LALAENEMLCYGFSFFRSQYKWMEASLAQQPPKLLALLAVATLLFGLTSLSFATDPAITWLKLTPSTSPSLAQQWPWLTTM